MTHCAAENVFFIIIHCVIGASSQISEIILLSLVEVEQI